MNEEVDVQIPSRDQAHLVHIVGIAAERTAIERQRAERAESRAATLLAAAGVVAGFLAYFGATVRQPSAGDPLVAVFFLGSSAFLLKTAYFAVRASWTIKGYELMPEAPLELQEMARIDALQEELRVRCWECRELQSVSMRRLFSLHRAQRNFVAGLVAFTALAALDVLSGWVKGAAPTWAVVLVAILLAAVIGLLDLIVEQHSGFWRWQDETPHTAQTPGSAVREGAEPPSVKLRGLSIIRRSITKWTASRKPRSEARAKAEGSLPRDEVPEVAPREKAALKPKSRRKEGRG